MAKEIGKLTLDSEALFAVCIKSSAKRRLECLKSLKTTQVAVKQRRTCLKWEMNGELSAIDRSNLMKLLCQVDKQACFEEDSELGLCDQK